MYFYEALKEMMDRKAKAKRKHWNGKEQYIQIVNYVSFRLPDGEIYNAHNFCIGNQAIAFLEPAVYRSDGWPVRLIYYPMIGKSYMMYRGI